MFKVICALKYLSELGPYGNDDFLIFSVLRDCKVIHCDYRMYYAIILHLAHAYFMNAINR